MFITTISMSYFFLGIALVSLVFFIYFKVLIVKTEDANPSKSSIIGKMKDPNQWRYTNNIMSYLSLFWFILSTAIFVFFKFYSKASLVSILYILGFLTAVVISIIYLSSKKKATL